ncbi:MAG: hypothetical protein ACXVH0_02215 [Thermoanaerobaculia bacterium]
MSESARTADRAGLFWTLLPHLVFAVLFVATFKRWILPFEDSGREMNTALRLARGEVLYRDVGYSYGPLPPFFDGILLRSFGRNLDVLIAWRTLLALLGVEALRRLARRLVSGEATAAAMCTFVVTACAFGVGGSWPFPYSVAALAGSVGAWWALELALVSASPAGSMAAAAVAGLAAGTKLEMLPVALAGPLLTLALRRPRKEALCAGVLMAGAAGFAFGVPVLWFGTGLMKRQGFLIALSVPESWRRVYESLLFGGTSPGAFAGGGFLNVLFPSALGIALVLLLPDEGAPRRRLFVPLFFTAGALTFFSPGNAWLHALLPLAACVAVYGLARAALALWRGEGHSSAPDPARLGVALVMLPALLRQPFFLRNPVYGAFSAPLALVVALSWLGRRTRSRGVLTALVLGLSVAQTAGRIHGIGMAEMTFTKLPGASVFLLPAESRFVTEAARVIRETVPEGGSAGIFPEPGFLLFVTGRRNPFVDELFVPGIQDAAAEDLMIRRLRERPPDALLITNRAFPEFGGAVYGNGLLDRFFLEVSRRYVFARRIGGEAGPVPLRHASEGLLFVPRQPDRGR